VSESLAVECDMGDEPFLSAILAAPEDPTNRLVYADWLDERDDPRAEVLRHNWNGQRINFIEWVQGQGNLDCYLERHPELRQELGKARSERVLADKLEALAPGVDPEWRAFMETLGRPFHPFFFWNNTGPRSFGPGDLPFREQIGTRGMVVTFQAAFRDSRRWDAGLVHDLRLLHGLRLRVCYYGAASCPVHPFICEVETTRRLMTGADVLGALKAREFRSQYIRALDVTTIPFPGYHPGTDNDEIHSDPAGQHLFPAGDDVWGESADADAAVDEDDGHDALRGYADGGQLWYVLLHSRTPDVTEGMDRHGWVILFAVGKSPHGQRLIGAVSHQLCHNLCD
jgi:uncharacterized protein (TIGR02996 family)